MERITNIDFSRPKYKDSSSETGVSLSFFSGIGDSFAFRSSSKLARGRGSLCLACARPSVAAPNKLKAFQLKTQKAEHKCIMTGSTGPILSESVPKLGHVTEFIYWNQILPKSVLPKIPKGSTRSVSYRIGTGLDQTEIGSYRIIVYWYFFI
ncbi:hypothetical protein H5410_013934 [Solanum commersonii]|uniref:Uncharacterized protein n=1 Tax=Solanum commersonii TaxID=4109 RepID=A0A9J5ZPK7_SOLCO|nr:hypothetical protein H5410_013934 [Solanum commersonii]